MTSVQSKPINTSGVDINNLPIEIVGKILKNITPEERYFIMKTKNKKIWNALAEYELLVHIPSKNISEISVILNTYGNYRYKYKHDGKKYSKKILFNVDLIHTKVSDVSMLGGVYKLNLYGTWVSDVSMLTNVNVIGYNR